MWEIKYLKERMCNKILVYLMNGKVRKTMYLSLSNLMNGC
jgi:hypothetical protein